MTRVTRSATDRQIIMGLLGAIRIHPVMNNPPVFYPVFGRQNQSKQVFVNKYRTFGGSELIEPGLTVAVYPAHTSYNLGGSSPNSSDYTTNFANFEPYTLGSPSSFSYFDKGRLRFVCQVYYRDSNFDTTYNVTYGVNELDSLDRIYQSFGETFSTPEDNQSYLETWDGNTQQVTFSILPGEEVIRDYCYLLRSVLREVGTLRPFGIRGLKVKSVDYPSSDWVKNSSNIIFHTAYITLEIELYETVHAKDPFYTNPTWGKDTQLTSDFKEDYKSSLREEGSQFRDTDKITRPSFKFISRSTLFLI